MQLGHSLLAFASWRRWRQGGAGEGMCKAVHLKHLGCTFTNSSTGVLLVGLALHCEYISGRQSKASPEMHVGAVICVTAGLRVRQFPQS